MKTGPDHEPIPCPGCRSKIDCGESLTGFGGGPRPGDYSICIYCESLIRYVTDTFTGKLALRFMTPDEQIEVAMDPSMNEAREQVALMRRLGHFTPRRPM